MVNASKKQVATETAISTTTEVSQDAQEAQAIAAATLTTSELLTVWEKEQPSLDFEKRKAIEDTVSVISSTLSQQSEGYLTIGTRLRKLEAEIGNVLFDSFLRESKVLQSLQVAAGTAEKWMEMSKVLENAIRNKSARQSLMMFAQRAIIVVRYAVLNTTTNVTTFTDDKSAPGSKAVGYMLSRFFQQALDKYPEPKKADDLAKCEVWARQVLYESNRLRGIYNAEFNKRNPRFAIGVNRKRIRQSVEKFFDYGEYDSKALFFELIRAYGKKFSADATEVLMAELDVVVDARDWEEGAAKALPSKPVGTHTAPKIEQKPTPVAASQVAAVVQNKHKQAVA